MYNVLKGMVLNYQKLLSHVCNDTSYPLRTNNLKMSLPKPKTDFFKKNFAYHGAASWSKVLSAIYDTRDSRVSISEFII